MSNYYQILQVEENATAEQIKKAFRKLSLQHHPDRPTGNEEEFKKISEAYEILSDPIKKQQYDSQIHGNSFGFDQMFDNIFGRQSATHSSNLNLDIVININITFAEMYCGTNKLVQFDSNKYCSSCNGAGGSLKVCDRCRGSGMSAIKNGPIIFQTTCGNCNGTGKIRQIITTCSSCNGKGFESTSQTETITIEPGLGEPGQTIRFKINNKGHQLGHFKGGLVVNLFTQLDKCFTKDKFNLVCKHYCKYSDLILGSSIQINLPDNNNIKVSIPKNTSVGAMLKVKGKGIKQIGDLLIAIGIEIPTNLTDKQLLLIEQLKENNL